MDPMMAGSGLPPGGDPMMDMGGGGMPGADPMGMPGADPMGMPPMPGEAGAPMDMAGAPPVGDGMDERPLKPKGYRGKMVFWSLGPTTHSFLCWSLLGTATFLLGIAVLGTPQIKPIAFATGQIPGTQSKMYIGWLGSCIGDEDTKWSTCTPPSFPLSISNFGQLEGRLAEVGKIFDKNSIKALAFNAAAAFFTLVAALMHRIGRNHGPFYLTLFAFVLTLVAFIVDAMIFYPSLKQLEENAGLEASLGLGFFAVGVSLLCLFLGCFVSYSRCVKAQLNWPTHDPHPDPHPDMNGPPPMAGGMDPMMGGGDPMMGGAPPGMGPPGGMDPMAGGMDPMGAPGGMDPMGGMPPMPGDPMGAPPGGVPGAPPPF